MAISVNDIHQTHKCKHIPKKGVHIECNFDEPPSCKLYIQREAEESDLEENGYLEIIGEIIWSTEIEIVYCPYCSARLIDSKLIEKDGYGNFRHIDSSGWSSNVL